MERKREEGDGEARNVAGHKRGPTKWRGGRGRSKLVSFETWQVTNEDSPTGGEEEGGGRWRALRLGRWHVRNEDRKGGEEGEGVDVGGSRISKKKKLTEWRGGRGGRGERRE